MKALDPPRKRVILYILLQALFLVAFFVELHMKAHLGVTLPTALAACLFMLAGLRAVYNLNLPYK
jgi:hypothetical protein